MRLLQLFCLALAATAFLGCQQNTTEPIWTCLCSPSSAARAPTVGQCQH